MLPEIAIKSFLVLAVAAAVAVLLRRSAAAIRHLVWTLAVVTVLALPVLIALAPRRALPVPDGSALALLARDGAEPSTVGSPPQSEGEPHDPLSAAGPGDRGDSRRAPNDGDDGAGDDGDVPGRGGPAVESAVPDANLRAGNAVDHAVPPPPDPAAAETGIAPTEGARRGSVPPPSASRARGLVSPRTLSLPQGVRSALFLVWLLGGLLDDDLRTLEWESDHCSAELRLRGELTFNDDFTVVTGISAGGSFRLVHREDGREVGLIRGNSTKSRYLIALVEQVELNDEALRRVLDIAGRDVDSNSSRGRVLTAVGRRHPQRVLDGGVADAYWRAVAAIDSNSTTSRLLEGLLEGEPQDAPMVTRVLEQAPLLIDSNSTLAGLLRGLQRQYPDILTREPQAMLFWQAAAGIDSNSTINGFLLDISGGAELDSNVLALVLDTAQARITSNSVLAEFVLALERRYPEISVSGPMTEEFWATVERVDSGSTLSSLLLSFARQQPDAARGRLRDRILEMARGIGSRSTRERTLRELGDLGIG